ncbi:trna nucleotidyltransferase poly polymerase family protein [Cystoisospora suis]|uniref:Trna nucleotidyltransferase poly polymerase family protein n=1 Tax=Cystoisospora suis TaxID=483139 RepID=A0A2C6KK25_9APIC|nr:trna nucleotidyltransferase poly polymerase family protein [Cystoisospora suis]
MKGLPTHAIGIVASNPDQSKHLETATVRLLSQYQVDFVHLRTESYSAHSRIPEAVEFGSPEEDARRRDFTLNALFYNLHTHQIEDYTETGVSDLQERLLRTPVENSEVIFLDDPLRVLRGIRLASVLNLKLHRNVVTGARRLAVREALKKKVSRERIGIELKKIVSGGAGGEGEGEKKKKKEEGREMNEEEEEGKRNVRVDDEDEEHGRTSREVCEEQGPTRERREEKEEEEKKMRERIRKGFKGTTRGFVLMVYLRVINSIFSLPSHISKTGEALSSSSSSSSLHRDQKKGKPMKKERNEKCLVKPEEEVKGDEENLLAASSWWRESLRSILLLDHLFSSSSTLASPSSSSFTSGPSVSRLKENFWCTDSSLLELPTSHEISEKEKEEEMSLLSQELTKSLFLSSPSSSSCKHLSSRQDNDRQEDSRMKKEEKEREALQGQDEEKNEKKKKRMKKDNEDGANKDESQWRDRLRAFSLSVLLSPLYPYTCLNEKKKPENLLFFIVVSALKLSRKDAEAAVCINLIASRFLQYLLKRREKEKAEREDNPDGEEKKNDVPSSEKEEKDDGKKEREKEERVELGLIIRESKGMWKESLLLALALLEKPPSLRHSSGVHTPSPRSLDIKEKEEDQSRVKSPSLHLSSSQVNGISEEERGENSLHLAKHTQKHKLSSASSSIGSEGASPALLSSSSSAGLGCEEDREAKKPKGGENEEKERREEEEEEEREVERAFFEVMTRGVSLEDLREVVRLRRRIEEFNLSHVDTALAPLLDGHELKTRCLKNLPKGPAFKEVLDAQVRWQLAHPEGSVEEFELFLSQAFPNYV